MQRSAIRDIAARMGRPRITLCGCTRAKNSRRHREPTAHDCVPAASAVIREPGKVRKDGGHQIAMMGIVRSQPRGVQIEDVARLGGGFRP